MVLGGTSTDAVSPRPFSFHGTLEDVPFYSTTNFGQLRAFKALTFTMSRTVGMERRGNRQGAKIGPAVGCPRKGGCGVAGFFFYRVFSSFFEVFSVVWVF